MKNYLKMADVFKRSVSVVEVSFLTNDHNNRYCDKYAAHAINSHDELVQINQDLLEALEAVIEWFDMEADHSIEPDFYKRVAACQASEDMVREAISKAKGGAA